MKIIKNIFFIFSLIILFGCGSSESANNHLWIVQASEPETHKSLWQSCGGTVLADCQRRNPEYANPGFIVSGNDITLSCFMQNHNSTTYNIYDIQQNASQCAATR